MHVYIENFGLSSSKQDILLFVALVGSVLLHGASLFFAQGKFTSGDVNPTATTATISSGNMESATPINSPNLKAYVPEVALDAPAISNYKAVGQIIIDTPALIESTGNDALSALESNTQSVAALGASTTKHLGLTTTTSQAPIDTNIGLQDLLIADNYANIEDGQYDNINISFTEISGLINPQVPGLTITEVTELIEEVPVITETTVISEKSPVSPLLGITFQFKQQIKKKLGKSILSIKPKIVRQKLYGSLRFQFTINRRGKLVSSKIVKSSNNKKLDALVLKMLKDNSPYTKLPKKYQGELLRFSYPISVKPK